MGIIALLATGGTSPIQIQKCERAREILEANSISYEVINGTDPDAAEARNLLFKLSKQFANYPLFFYENREDIKFIGNYIDLEILNYYHKIPDTYCSDNEDGSNVITYERCRSFLKSLNRKEISKHFSSEKVFTDEDYTTLFESVKRMMKTKHVNYATSQDEENERRRLERRRRRQQQRAAGMDDVSIDSTRSYEVNTMSPRKSRIMQKVNLLDLSRLELFDNSGPIVFSPPPSDKKKSNKSSLEASLRLLPDAFSSDDDDNNDYNRSINIFDNSNTNMNQANDADMKSHPKKSIRNHHSMSIIAESPSRGMKKASYLMNAAATNSRSPSPSGRSSSVSKVKIPEFFTSSPTKQREQQFSMSMSALSPVRSTQNRKKMSSNISPLRPGMVRGTSFDENDDENSEEDDDHHTKKKEEPKKKEKKSSKVSPLRPGMVRGASFDEENDDDDNDDRHNNEDHGKEVKKNKSVSPLRPGMVRGTLFDDDEEEDVVDADADDKNNRDNPSNRQQQPRKRISTMRPGMVRGTSFDEEDTKNESSATAAATNNNRSLSPPLTSRRDSVGKVKIPEFLTQSPTKDRGSNKFSMSMSSLSPMRATTKVQKLPVDLFSPFQEKNKNKSSKNKNDHVTSSNTAPSTRRVSNLRPGMIRGTSFDESDDDDNIRTKTEDEEHQQQSPIPTRRVSTLRPGMLRGTSFDEDTEDVQDVILQKQQQQQNQKQQEEQENDEQREHSPIPTGRRVSTLRPGMMRGTSFDENTEDVKDIILQNQQKQQKQGTTNSLGTPSPATMIGDGDDNASSDEENNDTPTRSRRISTLRPGVVRGVSFDENTEDIKKVDQQRQHTSHKKNDDNVGDDDDDDKSIEEKIENLHGEANDNYDNNSNSSSSEEAFWNAMSRSRMVRGLSYDNLDVEQIEKPVEAATKKIDSIQPTATDKHEGKTAAPTAKKSHKRKDARNMADSSHSHASYSTYDTSCSSTVQTVPPTSSAIMAPDSKLKMLSRNNDTEDDDQAAFPIKGGPSRVTNANTLSNLLTNAENKQNTLDDESIASQSISANKRTKPRKYMSHVSQPSNSKNEQNHVEPSQSQVDEGNKHDTTVDSSESETNDNNNVAAVDHDLSNYRIIKHGDDDSSEDSEEFWTSMRPKMQRGLSCDELEPNQVMESIPEIEKGKEIGTSHVSNRMMNNPMNNAFNEASDNIRIVVDLKVDPSMSEKIDKSGKRSSLDDNAQHSLSIFRDDQGHVKEDELNRKVEEKEKKKKKNKSEKEKKDKKDRSLSPKTDKQKKSNKVPFDPTKLMFVELHKKTNMADDGTIISEITTDDDLYKLYSTEKREKPRRTNI